MPQPHEFDTMLAIAKNEIQRDAPRIAKNLDLSADAGTASEAEMVDQVRRNWSNPQYRQDLEQRMAPDKFTALYLKAANVTNPDGTPMSVAQYQKQVSQPMAMGDSAAAPLSAPQPPAEALAPAGVHQPDPVTQQIALRSAPTSGGAPPNPPGNPGSGAGAPVSPFQPPTGGQLPQ